MTSGPISNADTRKHSGLPPAVLRTFICRQPVHAPVLHISVSRRSDEEPFLLLNHLWPI
jgi:hypothetical protein